MKSHSAEPIRNKYDVKAVEEYLRNNISTLRQRFDEEELAYSQL